jgi:Domain of unknown function (DUF929)
MAAPKRTSASRPRPRQMRKPVSRTPPWVLPAAVVAGLAVVVAAFFLIRNYINYTPTPLNTTSTTEVVSTITNLPGSEFDSVGQGSATNSFKPVSGSTLTGPSGKPEVFFYGAEYCPYCAAQRWALIVALSRFGTFAGLQTTSSSSTDVYANTPTFTFRNATFSSQYVDFVSVETTDRNRNPLQTPTSDQQQLVSLYDAAGSIPFIDFGNRYVTVGAMYLPDKLGGMSWQAVASALQQSSSPQAQAVIGSANLTTAAICKMTGDQPGAVCSDTTIQNLEKKLG